MTAPTVSSSSGVLALSASLRSILDDPSFELWPIVRSVLDTSPETDPDALVAEIISRLDKPQYHDALVFALRNYVQKAVTNVRSSNKATNGGALPPARPKRKIKKPGRPFHRDPQWKRVLRQREFNPETGTSIFMENATKDDLVAIANDRYSKAEAMRAKGDWYIKIAAALDTYSKATVGELDQEVLEDLFGM